MKGYNFIALLTLIYLSFLLPVIYIADMLSLINNSPIQSEIIFLFIFIPLVVNSFLTFYIVLLKNYMRMKYGG